MISGMFRAAKAAFQKLRGAPAPKRGASYLADAVSAKVPKKVDRKERRAPAALVRFLRGPARRRLAQRRRFNVAHQGAQTLVRFEGEA